MTVMPTASASMTAHEEVKIERLRLSKPLYVVELWEHEQNLEQERLETLKAQTPIRKPVRDRARVQGFNPFWRRASAPLTPPATVARVSALRRLEQFASAAEVAAGSC